MRDTFTAVDPTPLKYRWEIRPSVPFDWQLLCELGRHHASIQVTESGTFKVKTRNMLHGPEEEFDTMAEAEAAVYRTLGLEVKP